MIQQIVSKTEKERIARAVLTGLPEWFGLEDSREAYIAGSRDQTFFAAVENGLPIGFLTLKKTGEATVELAVMGILKSHHRRGIGRQLVLWAKEYARGQGYSFLQVKTVVSGQYPEYDATNRFYQSLGFQEFEVFPTLWDAWNPCQIYVMALS